jgi:hypothetical protein
MEPDHNHNMPLNASRLCISQAAPRPAHAYVYDQQDISGKSSCAVLMLLLLLWHSQG